ncbi:Ubiquitin-conjugating_enzyme E2-17 kDa [Hexamita inflata]|uniref:Ubiquitin-conjugating enzyme E2-17 kDa n=1 Tax=Hexamita inflata TaxID=28002 RepID=A0AA86QB84_9EUKA|nr:Ubiquitin-conjugating enzyme E2-17 kDa [Hexamita inflata]CAI9954378.1 Ubiquitin-conjugating enzyme E2-17 kDa [Hexamita inflata]CAI9954841.1 Ubiquitin-conjugating enzyme E2-17 kDa [Hexamita inflata]CAI9977707.1 Ubiquitin-conjugating enzyme E2-17 kDa [Hexamita inflata]
MNRLQNEARKLMKEKAQHEKEGIVIQPTRPNDLSQWEIIISFSDVNSLYCNQKYRIIADIPATYPHQCPKCKFDSHIFHPNINADNGKICLNIINEENNEWTAVMSLSQIAYGLQSLVYGPNLDSPLNLDAGSIFRNQDLRAAKSLINYFYALNQK